MAQETKRERYQARLQALVSARSSWEQEWRDISRQLLPGQAVWDPTQPARGERKDRHILNNRPVRALRALAAGLMAGITSPARDWFNLTTSDPELAKQDDVKAYLDECKHRVASALQVSNWYRSLSSAVYPHLGSVATAAMFHEETPGGVSFRPMSIGEYFLDIDHNGKVDTCFRRLWMTARQIAQKFGLGNASSMIQDAYRLGNYDQGCVVVHAVQPSDEYEAGRIGPAGMLWSSCWWEESDDKRDKFLTESGYEEFPILAPRWTAMPREVYGRGPGWDALGDCRLLQHHERRKLEMLDKIVDPPMRATGNVRRASLLPGEITQMPKDGNGKFEPAIVIDPRAMNEAREDILRTEDRIADTLFTNVLQHFLDEDRAQPATATEIEAKRNEIALQLGPLLENLNTELLEPAVERTFNVLKSIGRLPPPPDDLQGQLVKVEFISIMHQAQQTTGLIGIRTLVQEVGAIASMRPDVLDKVDVDVVADELGRITGVKPDIIISADKVAATRKIRAQQQEAQQNGQAFLAATQGAKNLGGADAGNISDLAGMIAPAAAAQAGAVGPTTTT